MTPKQASDEQVTSELAVRILGWKAAPDRYLKGDRSWIPRWRFTPLTRIEDAFQLLERACRYRLQLNDDGIFVAEVRIGGSTGKASGKFQARVITLAIAKAVGVEVLQ
ncbi:MAG: hypothetical protein WB992_01900 [Bryobacteraceae bacterium]